MSRTWTLNAAELLRVVWEGDLDNVLKEVTPESVGRVGICRNDRRRNVEPLDIATIGRIDFVSKEGAFVSLKDVDGKEHVDGPEGEVYVLEYHKRKKVGRDDLPRSLCCCWCCYDILFRYIFFVLLYMLYILVCFFFCCLFVFFLLACSHTIHYFFPTILPNI